MSQLPARPRREAVQASKAEWAIYDDTREEILRQNAIAGITKHVMRRAVDVDAERIALVAEHGPHINPLLVEIEQTGVRQMVASQRTFTPGKKGLYG